MVVNRKELARRIASIGGYDIGEIERVLKIYEDVIVEALDNEEEIKQGKLFKIFFQNVPKKIAWDGLNKRSFVRPAKRVPKFKPLSRIKDIEHQIDEEDTERK